jgi:hypothetical protein
MISGSTVTGMGHPNQDAVWVVADAVDACSNNDAALEAAFAKLLDNQVLNPVEYVDLRRAVITQLEGYERDIAKALLDSEWDRMAAAVRVQERSRLDASRPVLGL